MEKYELSYLITPDVSESESQELQTKISSFIKGEALNIKKVSLAYSIKKKLEAWLSTIIFSDSNIEELDKKLEKEPKILRHLIIKKPLIKERAIRAKREKPEQEPEKKIELKDIDKKLEEILE